MSTFLSRFGHAPLTYTYVIRLQQGLSEAELLEMEGVEREHVEARIRCLRNVQVLLDAAVLEMQQYSAVVARLDSK